jgi:hypothetical protein
MSSQSGGDGLVDDVMAECFQAPAARRAAEEVPLDVMHPCLVLGMSMGSGACSQRILLVGHASRRVVGRVVGRHRPAVDRRRWVRVHGVRAQHRAHVHDARQRGFAQQRDEGVRDVDHAEEVHVELEASGVTRQLRGLGEVRYAEIELSRRSHGLVVRRVTTGV